MALTPPPSAPPAAPEAPGDAPSRANPGTFRVLADAFVSWLVGFRDSVADLRTWLADFVAWADTHVTEVNGLIVEIDAATTAAASAAADREAAEAARDASVAMVFPRQKFTGPGPWTLTAGTLHTHHFSIIGTAFYDASHFTVLDQTITPVSVPFVPANQEVIHFYT